MIGLIHETLVVLGLVVKLFFDVVFHFVADESTGDFVGDLAQQREVV